MSRVFKAALLALSVLSVAPQLARADAGAGVTTR
jgi:hypothetical protein